MILAAADGSNTSQIARELGGSVETVRTWGMRWSGLQAVWREDLPINERLRDAPRPGPPAQITAEQTCQMIVMACEQPKEGPISHGTGREIADEVMARGSIAPISPRHAARLLKKGISSHT